MYYQIVGESRNSYTRLVFLNELVSGQNRSYLDDLLIKEKEPPLRFHPEDCRICLLGLRKAVYSGIYGLSTNDYMELYIQFEQHMQDLFSRYGYTGEIFLHLYADKQIIMIVSPGSHSGLSLDRLFSLAQEFLQKQYCETFLKDARYCNQTYFTRDSQSMENLPTVLSELMMLSGKKYFLMEPMTLTPEKLAQIRVFPDASDIQKLTQGVISAVNLGDFETFKNNLLDLMLGKIKYSFDSYLLHDTALLLKRFYLQCSRAYDIPVSDGIDSAFDAEIYPSIEMFTEALHDLFAECIEIITRREQRFSRITQLALSTIKISYCRWDISLTFIADQIHVSPSYLSSIFNREVGMNIASYIRDLRIEKAKSMLSDRSELICDIAREVGFKNKRYFSEVFKQNEGMTPREFREKQQE